MPNYNDTRCYAFEKSDKMLEIIHLITCFGRDEKAIAKDWCDIDPEKILEKPENFSNLSEDEKNKWIAENYGFITDFSYSVYENYTVFWVENRWTISNNLFEKFSEKYNIPVYIENLFGGDDVLYVYKNPQKRIYFQLEMPNPSCNKTEAPSSFINFSMIGVENNIYGAINNKNSPIEENGSIIWKQHYMNEKEKRIKLEENSKNKDNVDFDDDFEDFS